MNEVFELIGMIVTIGFSVLILVCFIAGMIEKFKNRNIICKKCGRSRYKSWSKKFMGMQFCCDECILKYCKEIR